MTFTKDEKAVLKRLVEEEIKEFEKEGSTIIHADFPNFEAAEFKYDEFLKSLLKKID